MVLSVPRILLLSAAVLALWCSKRSFIRPGMQRPPRIGPQLSHTRQPRSLTSWRSRLFASAYRRNRGFRLSYEAGHYSKWNWDAGDGLARKVNYVRRGPTNGKKVVLVHGFGGSAYHWRHNILVLADAGFDVYACDLLGFGRSEKPLLKYGAQLWRDQLVAFIEQVVGSPVALIGNSLGGYASLKAAADRADLVVQLALLNGAGPFRGDDSEAMLRSQLLRGGESMLLALGRLAATGAPLPGWARVELERLLVSSAFLYLRTPQRIRELLESLYPANSNNIDDELISSILLPAYHPNAMEVYFRLVSSTAQGNTTSEADSADALCERLEQPLLLLWGDMDPWVKPTAADRLEQAYKGHDLERVRLQAGHCTMDEVPEQVNDVLLAWLDGPKQVS